jgi:hypothetical protein
MPLMEIFGAESSSPISVPRISTGASIFNCSCSARSRARSRSPRSFPSRLQDAPSRRASDPSCSFARTPFHAECPPPATHRRDRPACPSALRRLALQRLGCRDDAGQDCAASPRTCPADARRQRSPAPLFRWPAARPLPNPQPSANRPHRARRRPFIEQAEEPMLPSAASFCAFCARSIALSTAFISAARAQRVQRAGLDQRLDHALVHHPQVDLLAELPQALEAPAHSSRAFMIDSIALPPTFFTAARPKRIASPSAETCGVNCAPETCTSGGSRECPSPCTRRCTSPRSQASRFPKSAARP